MNFVTALRFVHEHNDMVLAVLIALFLLTAILLLLRSIGKGSEGAHATAGGGVALDQDALEAAMRKVLGHKGSSTQAPADSHAHAVEVKPVDVNAASSQELAEAIAEREKQIEVLQIAVKEARDQAAQAMAAAPAPGAEAGTGVADSALKSRVDELEAKLSEYEIITDDIADLSLFKDENSRMKVELDEMRAKLAEALAAAAAAREAGASAPAAPVSRIATDEESELKFEKAEKFELDINDDVMKAFAEAVDSGKIEKAPGAYSLPADEVEPEVRKALEDNLNAAPPAEPAADPQAAIDAMLAAASAPEPAADPQAAIDAMLAAASAPEPAADPQAAIDAMLAAASAPEPAADPQASVDAMFAAASESAPSAPPVAEEISAAALDPQAMIDAMMKQAEAVLPDASSEAAGARDELSPDALRMISEVEKLSDQAADVAADADADALLDQLDTEKLLSEASTLSNDLSLESSAKDDLFAEFKDEKGNES